MERDHRDAVFSANGSRIPRAVELAKLQADAQAVNQNTVIGEAKTTLTANMDGTKKSTVYLHYSDEGGDNFIVEAYLLKVSTD